MMVWQEHARNEWSVSIERILDRSEGGPAPAGTGCDPFSVADPVTVEEFLWAAGFREVTFTDVHVPIFFGPDTSTALEWVSGFSSTREAVERLHPAAAEHALQRLSETLAAHAGERGVWFDSRAWIVEARRTHQSQEPSVGISTFE
jgi:hypothetical protein